MQVKAVIFGAIGTMAETSEVQREAFNLAFRQSGLDWHWDEMTYRRLLHRPGGQRRIAEEAERLGVLVDAAEVHSRKVANFRALVLSRGITPRPGVAELVTAALRQGILLGWATTTTPQSRALIAEGLADALPLDRFAFTGDLALDVAPKPAPDIYLAALDVLGVTAAEALAIEDTPESAEAARAAGLPTLAFPGVAAAGRAFPEGCHRVDRLDAGLLTGVTAAV